MVSALVLVLGICCGLPAVARGELPADGWVASWWEMGVGDGERKRRVKKSFAIGGELVHI